MRKLFVLLTFFSVTMIPQAECEDNPPGLRMLENEIISLEKQIRKNRDDLDAVRLVIKQFEEDLEDMQRGFSGVWTGLHRAAMETPCDMHIGYIKSIIDHERLERLLTTRENLCHARLFEKRMIAQIKTTSLEFRSKTRKFNLLRKNPQTGGDNRIEKLLADIPGDTGTTDITEFRGALAWPLRGRILREFGTYETGGVGQVSRGIDIGTVEGAPVRSVFDGDVVFAGWIDTYGFTIIIDHTRGLYSVYGHLQKIMKSAGTRVTPGELIALAGKSGMTDSPRLHFEIRVDNLAKDPESWLEP